MARTNMASLITLFRTFRADISTDVYTDDQVESLFDINRERIDRISLSPDSSNIIFETPFKWIESAPTLINSNDVAVTVNATNSNNIQGIYVFNDEQSLPIRMKGWRHNLFYTLAIAYRTIAQQDDAWNSYKRGNVQFSRREFESMANEYERMGFEPKKITLARN